MNRSAHPSIHPSMGAPPDGWNRSALWFMGGPLDGRMFTLVHGCAPGWIDGCSLWFMDAPSESIILYTLIRV